MSEYSELISKNYDFEQVDASSRFFKPHQILSGRYFVSAEWVREHLGQVKVIEILNDSDEKFSCRMADEYKAGHIPGAMGMFRNELGPVKDYFIDDQSLIKLFKSYGITSQDTVIFYSAYTRYGLYSASRAAFATYYLGVKDVRILDGGWQAWEAADFQVEEGIAEKIPVLEFGLKEPSRKDVLISSPADVKDFMAENDQAILVSIRSLNEYLGLNQGSSWNRGKGEIAGALYGGDNKLLNELGYLSDPQEYLEEWKSSGITPDKDIILYCGTSWRASTAFFILKELGWPSVYLFDGSWHKWHEAHDTDPEQFPIQMGMPGSDDFRIIDGNN